MKKALLIPLTVISLLILTACPDGIVDDGNTMRDNVKILSTTYSDGVAVVFYEEPQASDFSYTAMFFTPAVSGLTQPVTVKAGEGVLAKTTSMIAAVGLTNDTEYTFTIKAVYSDDTESEGIVKKITPRSVVSAPEDLTAVRGNGEVTLNWEVPADNNWIAVTVEFTPDDPDYAQPVGLSPDVTTLKIDGLDNGTEYSFTVSAVDLFDKKSSGAAISAIPSENLTPPTDNAVSIFLIDTDMDAGQLAGVCSIEKAADESSIEQYKLYWGSSATAKLGTTAITSIDKTGSDLEYSFAENTAPPSGTTHLLIYSSNSDGETETPLAYKLEDFSVTQEPYSGAMNGVIIIGTNYYTSFGDPDLNIYKWNGTTFATVTGISVTWSSYPFAMASYGNKLMFTTMEPGAYVLWEYDIAGGTVMQIPGSERIMNIGIEYGSRFCFIIEDETIGDSLYEYDGSNIQLVYDCDDDSNEQYSSVMCVFDNKLLFTATDAESRTEMYSYDGTDIEQITSFGGSATICASPYIEKNNTFYFLAGSDANNCELYSWDGASVSQETHLIDAGYATNDFLSNIAEYKNDIYFSAGNTTIGFELWKFNGEEESIAYDFYPDGSGFLNDYGGFATFVMDFNDYLFMEAYHEGDGNMLHLYDGVHVPVPLVDVDSDDNISELTYTVPMFEIDGDLIFMNIDSSNYYSYYRLHIGSF